MTQRPTHPGWFSPPKGMKIGGRLLRVDLVNLQPIRWNGEWAFLAAIPGCWCGRPMTGYPMPFACTDSTGYNWQCDEHGNDGLVENILISGRYVSVLSNWDIDMATVIEVASGTWIMRAQRQPASKERKG